MSKSYTVKKGDTLSAISVRQYGLAAKWVQIKNANPQLVGSDPALSEADEVCSQSEYIIYHDGIVYVFQ